jgi:hypothetical protein
MGAPSTSGGSAPSRVPGPGAVSLAGAAPSAASASATGSATARAPSLGRPADRGPVTRRAAVDGIAGRAAVIAPSSAIAAAERLVELLGAQVDRQRRDDVTKKAEIDNLVRSVGQRESEVRRDFESKRMFGLLAMLICPVVGVTSLAMAQNDDARLKTLRQSLDQARRRQAAASAELSKLDGLSARARASLEALRSQERALSSEPRILKPGKGKLAQAGRHAAEILRQRALTANLGQQVAILEALKGAGAAVGVDLDAVIAELREAASAATRLAEASKSELGDLLQILASADPEEAAQRWLTDALRSKVRAELERGVSRIAPAPLVEPLVSALLG